MTMQNLKSRLFIDHIVLVVKNIKITKRFYTKIFGNPDHQSKFFLMYLVGKTKLFLALPYGKLPKNDKFSANRIGLEHLAFGVPSLKILKQISSHLSKARIAHSGIHIDRHSKKEKIWLNDPDGIRLEFYR